MKYVKAGDSAPTPDQLEKIKAEAVDQLDKYSADSQTFKPSSSQTVSLHRLVLVFHGGDCVLAEEV